MNSTVSKIPCSLSKFFKFWLQFTAPMHKLQNKDIEILAAILKKRYELCKIITDDNVIDSYLFSKEIREQIIEETGESKSNFQVALSKMRKKGIIINSNQLNKKFIPPLSKDSKRFDLMFLFEIKNDSE